MNNYAEDNLDVAHTLAAVFTRRYRGHLAYEDLLSAAYLGLATAASRFDPARGVTFRTYASRVIAGALMDTARGSLRARGFRRRRVDHHRMEPVLTFASIADVPERTVAANQERALLQAERAAGRRASLLAATRIPRDRMMVRALMAGQTQAEAGRVINRSVETVYLRLRAIERQVRASA